jgi:hypothetical protein
MGRGTFPAEPGKTWETTTRNPLLFQSLFGLFLLRTAQRAFSRLLLNDPPRTTRRSLRPAPAQKGNREGRPYVPLVCLIQPPSSPPISRTICETWRYCPSFSHSQWTARRR